MSGLFTWYLIVLFLMLIVLIRMIRQISARQKKINRKHIRCLNAIFKEDNPKDSKYFDCADKCEAELQKLKYNKTMAYIVALAIAYCIFDCLMFNI